MDSYLMPKPAKLSSLISAGEAWRRCTGSTEPSVGMPKSACCGASVGRNFCIPGFKLRERAWRTAVGSETAWVEQENKTELKGAGMVWINRQIEYYMFLEEFEWIFSISVNIEAVAEMCKEICGHWRHFADLQHLWDQISLSGCWIPGGVRSSHGFAGAIQRSATSFGIVRVIDKSDPMLKTSQNHVWDLGYIMVYWW